MQTRLFLWCVCLLGVQSTLWVRADFFASSSSLPGSGGSWDFWWAYDGISGPEYWGLINPEWSLCSKGKRQSPVDIKPDQLLFDPTLEPVQIVGDKINGTIENTGKGVFVHVNQSADSSWRIILNKGPLSYNYTLNHIVLHYGGDEVKGSEHTIDGISFPGELQLYTYNSQLYSSWSEAENRPNGVAALSLMVLLSDYEHQTKENKEIKVLTNGLRISSNKGQPHFVTGLSIQGLLPQNTKNYLTYEGSLTQPSCAENVEWIILNKPIYVSSQDMALIRNSINGFGDNFRPTQQLLRRCIRTNIDFHSTSSPSSSTMHHMDNINNINNVTSGVRHQKGSCSMNRFTFYKKSTLSRT